jgi:pyridinium-3,5-biscarboxylic acid mononucleotide synthase
VDPTRLSALLHDVRDGRTTPEEALARLKQLPFEDLGFARLDHHRALRRGFGEVVFGAGKTPEQVATILERMSAAGHNVLVTRTQAAVAEPVERALAARAGGPSPTVRWHETARCLTVVREPPPSLEGAVAVVCAGTSDLPVAEEASVTAEFHGAIVERVYDVGVAGIHRLLESADVLRRCRVVVVAAGMEGALPSVVGGLVESPVIAVPTSVGYGASFGGLAALLAMLNSCASGVAVVNIDNGFGAGYMACSILRTRLP